MENFISTNRILQLPAIPPRFSYITIAERALSNRMPSIYSMQLAITDAVVSRKLLNNCELIYSLLLYLLSELETLLEFNRSVGERFVYSSKQISNQENLSSALFTRVLIILLSDKLNNLCTKTNVKENVHKLFENK